MRLARGVTLARLSPTYGTGSAPVTSHFLAGGLTLPGVGRIIGRMNDASSKAAVDQELKQLERRLDDLVAMVAQLQEENRALRQRQDSMMSERATLLQKNEQVRARVEAMIGRLKAMEHSA
jgi:cell division protein ZapB